MKAIVRNVLLACLISAFALFGALGRGATNEAAGAKFSAKEVAIERTESRKETLYCLSIGILAWVLCFWRCSAINRRLNEERMYQQRFNAYIRSDPYNQRLYR